MEIKLATICEYVTIDNTGKLSLMGIFDAINASSFPISISKMYLVLVVKGNISEIGEHNITIDFINEEGKNIITSGSFKFTLNKGVIPSSNVIIDFNNMHIEKSGDYQFVINIDNETDIQIPLKITSALN